MIDRAQVPLRRRKQDRPLELLAAAKAMFIEKGFSSLDEPAQPPACTLDLLLQGLANRDAAAAGAAR